MSDFMTDKQIEGLLADIEDNVSIIVEKKHYEELLAELDKLRWIPVSEGPPEYIPTMTQSKGLEMIDNGEIRIGCYEKEEYVWWNGAFCNKDRLNNQKYITHYRLITLSETE